MRPTTISRNRPAIARGRTAPARRRGSWSSSSECGKPVAEDQLPLLECEIGASLPFKSFGLACALTRCVEPRAYLGDFERCVKVRSEVAAVACGVGDGLLDGSVCFVKDVACAGRKI